MAQEGWNVMSDPRASVVVLVWNGIGYLETCLDTVLAQDYADFEVIVVDNGSTDGSPDLVAERFPQVRLVRNQRNLGFAAGNNVGLRAAGGDLLVLLNQDTQVHAGWLAALARVFADPAIGIAGCKLLYPDGTIQHAGGTLYGPRGESAHVGRHAPDDGRFDQVADVDCVTAAALAISRAALEQIGPLDEGFAPAYYEDTDWCYRARAAGFRVVYQPQAVVTHHESTATGALGHARKFALNQGRLRFLFKHWPLERLLNEFGPAELAWVAGMDRCEELMAARRTYLNTLLALSGILDFRQSSPAEADALVGLLIDLRAAAMIGLASPALSSSEGTLTLPDHTQAYLLHSLQEMQMLQEQPFTSQVPVLGGLIVAIRNLWNSVAAKWYVRPLIQQQSSFNAQVVRYLEGQSRDVAENIRELTALAEHLAASETRPSGDPQSGAGKD
jgi:GT2 family glycosyltransferase